MAGHFLDEAHIHLFLAELEREGKVYGPAVSDEEVVVFAPVISSAGLFLDYCRTLVPPKKFLLPPREDVLLFRPDTGYLLAEKAAAAIVLFGLHPCDLQGLAYLDRVFLGEDPDPFYLARRQGMFLVGISCDPDGFCFCEELGCRSPSGFDLFFQRAPGGFFVLSGSSRGDGVLERGGNLFSQEVAPFSPVPLGEAIAVSCDPLPESPLWEEFGRRCLSCGACSACCPTCYCFDVREYGELDGEGARRVREWDNCLFIDHGAVAGGNFRENRSERLRYRYRHKYGGFGPLRGASSCVGCGRCRVVCPVGIDLWQIARASGAGSGGAS